MKQWKILSGSTAVMLVLAGAAQADVTAKDVWTNFKSVYSGTGQSLTAGTEEMSGDTLTLRDVKIAMDSPEARVDATIPMMAFRENGDGTVTITSSDSYVMTMTGPDNEFDVEMTMSQPDVSVIASGDAEAVKYDFTAPSMAIDVTRLTVEEETIEGDMRMSLTNTTGSYLVGSGENAQLESEAQAESLSVTIALKEPGGDGTFNADIGMADLGITADGSVAMMSMGGDMAEMLKSGFATDTRITHGAATYAMNLLDDEESFDFSGQATSGHIDIGLDKDALNYDIGTKGLSFTLKGSDIPLPEVAAKFGELGFGLLMPVGKTEEPEDFAFKLTMANVSVSEMIWGMVDPGGALPHDPATLIVDLAGTAKLFFDIMDPNSAEAMAQDVPGEIHSLDINAIRLAIAGAELTGDGGFTFDNTDMTTFDGLPAPTGSVDLKLVGANALIDTLVSMGLVPQDQAMGARMMMGLFARPGDGEDTLVSTIEVKGDGSVSANGQRLQ